MQAPRMPEFRFLDPDKQEFRIDLPFVPERLVVICWDVVGPVAGGGTGGKPPKEFKFEVRPVSVPPDPCPDDD